MSDLSIISDPDCTTHNDGDNYPDSPFSMTQRAREVGIDVTWASSPTRQQNKPTFQKHKPNKDKDSTPTSTVVRRKSFLPTNTPKKLFKPSIAKTPPKTGIYKFMDGVRSLFPEGSSSWPPRLSQKTSTPRATNRSAECENVHTEVDNSVTNLLFETASDSVSWSETKHYKVPKHHSDITADVLSTSLQNEFLNDNEFDMELVKSSQEAEAQFLQQQQSTTNVPKNQNSMYNFFEQDSFDALFASKELDQLIAQSQQMDAQPRKANILSLERHKSMPSGRTRTPLKRRFVD